VFRDCIFNHTRFELGNQITVFLQRCVFDSGSSGKDDLLAVYGNVSIVDCNFVEETATKTAVRNYYGEPVGSLKVCGSNFTNVKIGIHSETSYLSVANCYLTGVVECGLKTGSNGTWLAIANSYFDAGSGGYAVEATTLMVGTVEGSFFSGGWLLGGTESSTLTIDSASCFAKSFSDAGLASASFPGKVNYTESSFGRDNCLSTFAFGAKSLCDEFFFFYPTPSPLPPFGSFEIITATPTASASKRMSVTVTPLETFTQSPVPTMTPLETFTQSPVPTMTPLETFTQSPVHTASPLETSAQSPVPTASPWETSAQTEVPSGTARVTATVEVAAGAQAGSKGAVIGGAIVGGVVGLAAIAALVLYVLFKRKKQNMDFGGEPSTLPRTLEPAADRHGNEYGLSDGLIDDETGGGRSSKKTH
jgi:hypothetical protein